MSRPEHLQRFQDHLSEQGLKFTRQRRAIAEVFFQSTRHLTLNDLLELARAEHPGVGYATVYRTMKLLADAGLASEHRFDEGQARYEPAVDGEHHDHIICSSCGKIVEFEDREIERRQDRILAGLGFRALSHRHEIYAECVKPDCPDRPAPD